VYFALLSVWDNAGSYDQIGLSNYYGSWGVGYSTSTFCAANYHTDDFAFALTRGQSYSFSMAIDAGVVTFTASNGSTEHVVWSTSATTGGTDFIVGGAFACNSYVSYDYTDYEEVYQTTGPVPPYDFFFLNNSVNGSLEASWGTFSSGAPGAIVIAHSGANVTIENEPYYVEFGPGEANSLAVEDSTLSRTYSSVLSIIDLGSAVRVSLASKEYQAVGVPGLQTLLPVAWNVSFARAVGNPTFSTEVSLSFPSSTQAGTYFVILNVSNAGGSYSRVSLTVAVLPQLSASLNGNPASGAIDLGQSVTFAANLSGGEPPYEFEWVSLPPGCVPGTSPRVLCSPTSNGAYLVEIFVGDDLGYTASTAILYSIQSDPSVSVIPPGGQLLAQQSLTLYAEAIGGSGRFTFVWNGLPSGCSSVDSSSLTCSPQQPGTYNVGVSVRDTNGEQAAGNLSVTIAASFLGLPALDGYLLFIGLPVLLVVAIVAILIVSRRSGKRDDRGFGPAEGETELLAPNPGSTGQTPWALTANRGAGSPGPGIAEGIVPPVQFEGSSSPDSGLDPGSVASSTPLINPPDTVCWNCQSENPPGSRYCARCAVPLEPPPPP
jgi:hypothetical protein